jgi:hypothetical protein
VHPKAFHVKVLYVFAIPLLPLWMISSGPLRLLGAFIEIKKVSDKKENSKGHSA